VFAGAYTILRGGTKEVAKISRFQSLLVSRQGEERVFGPGDEPVALVPGDVIEIQGRSALLKTIDGEEMEFFPDGFPLTIDVVNEALVLKSKAGTINGVFSRGTTLIILGPLKIRPEPDSSVRAKILRDGSAATVKAKLKGVSAEIPGVLSLHLSTGTKPKKGASAEAVIEIGIGRYTVHASNHGVDEPVVLAGAKGPEIRMFDGCQAIVHKSEVVSATPGRFESEVPLREQKPEPATAPAQGVEEPALPKPVPAPPDPVEPEPEVTDPDPTPEETPATEPVVEHPAVENPAPPDAEPGAGNGEDPVPARPTKEPEIVEEPVAPPDSSPDIADYETPSETSAPPAEEPSGSDRVLPAVWVMRGDVRLVRGEQTVKLAYGRTRVEKGDIVRVGEGSKAKVETSEGIAYILEENSEFRIQ
jgi:hypothetical protein